RYWLHNGFVNIDNEKMSKSLGNFFTLRDVLAKVHPEVLRFFLASSHYRSPIDYNDRSLAEAKAGLDRLYRVKEKAEACRAAGAVPSELPPGEEVAPLRAAPERFAASMDDDFNTAAALGHLFEAIRALNRLAPEEPAAEREGAGPFLAGYDLLDPLFGVLGLLRAPSAEYFQAAGAAGRMAEGEILGRIEARRAARAAKQFAEADRIRKELEAAGVLLEDGKGGTTWKYKE
ncbi:MAG TPA: DALR domain-containing protein, partial [Candidatus Methylomirabilis sp.]|nr:DALR domain-containing protein [Candidatus Methylomirabilis sp.]